LKATGMVSGQDDPDDRNDDFNETFMPLVACAALDPCRLLPLITDIEGTQIDVRQVPSATKNGTGHRRGRSDTFNDVAAKGRQLGLTLAVLRVQRHRASAAPSAARQAPALPSSWHFSHRSAPT